MEKNDKIHSNEVDGLMLVIEKNSAYVCSADSLENVLLTLKKIAGGRWVLAQQGETDNAPNPSPCPQKPGNKHYHLVKREESYLEGFVSQEIGLA